MNEIYWWAAFSGQRVTVQWSQRKLGDPSHLHNIDIYFDEYDFFDSEARIGLYRNGIRLKMPSAWVAVY